MTEALKRRFDLRQQGLVTGRVMWGSVILEEVRGLDNGWEFSWPLLRLREIERVILSRHGNIVPDPFGTDDVDTCLAYANAVEASKTPQDIVHWSRRWLPWAPASEMDRIVLQEGWRNRPVGADDVATMIYVSAAERQALGLRTIGAWDVPKAVRLAAAAEVKRERDRLRQSDRRRAAGRVDRAAYLQNSLSAQKPWEAEDISRRTWERRQARDASVSPVSIYITNSDTPATDDNQDHVLARRAA